jgi:hypothetical protein
VPGVTADTNIYVSGYQFGGSPRRFLDLGAAAGFRLDISEAILDETVRVLRHRFHWSPAELRQLQHDILGYAHFVTPGPALEVITADPSDNRILECAISCPRKLRRDFYRDGDGFSGTASSGPALTGFESDTGPPISASVHTIGQLPQLESNRGSPGRVRSGVAFSPGTEISHWRIASASCWPSRKLQRGKPCFARSSSKNSSAGRVRPAFTSS